MDGGKVRCIVYYLSSSRKGKEENQRSVRVRVLRDEMAGAGANEWGWMVGMDGGEVVLEGWFDGLMVLEWNG